MYKYQETDKKYKKTHPVEAAKWNRDGARRWRLKRKMKIVEIFGGKCVFCGFSDWRALQVDHVNGGGLREVSTFSHRDKYYEHIVKLKDSGKYQLLCANCNWIKRYEEKAGRMV